MADFFGVDIAEVVFDATRGNLIVGTLTRRQGTAIKNYVFEGAPGKLEDSTDSQAISSSRKQQLTIIARSITPVTTPQNQDVVKFQESEYTILAVETDGAEATYSCTIAPR